MIAIPGIPLAIMHYSATTHFSYEFLQPANQITRIQLIDVDAYIGLYEHDLDKIPSMLDDASTVVTELPPSAYGDFLTDLAAVPCHRSSMDPSSFIADEAIVITYADGSREWLAAHGTFYHDTRTGEASMTRFYFKDTSFLVLFRVYDEP